MNENLNVPESDYPTDLKGLRAYCGGKEALVQKVLNSFVEVSPQYLKELSEVLVNGNCEEIRALCHKIRGAGSIIRADSLLEIVAQIRQSSIDAELDQAKERMPALEKAVADISDFIKKLGFTPS